MIAYIFGSIAVWLFILLWWVILQMNAFVEPAIIWTVFVIGIYWDKRKKWLYIFPIPFFGIVIKFKKEVNNYGNN